MLIMARNLSPQQYPLIYVQCTLCTNWADSDLLEIRTFLNWNLEIKGLFRVNESICSADWFAQTPYQEFKNKLTFQWRLIHQRKLCKVAVFLPRQKYLEHPSLQYQQLLSQIRKNLVFTSIYLKFIKKDHSTLIARYSIQFYGF